jgi:hypothetical protein
LQRTNPITFPHTGTRIFPASADGIFIANFIVHEKLGKMVAQLRVEYPEAGKKLRMTT